MKGNRWQRLGLRAWNRVNRGLLKSPLHRTVSQHTLLLTVYGRQTGRSYTFPVNYVQDGLTLWLVSWRERSWWRNLRKPAPVVIELRGERQVATAVVEPTGSATLNGLAHYCRRFPKAAAAIGVKQYPSGLIDRHSLVEMSEKLVVIQVTLQPAWNERLAHIRRLAR